jgi:hypothetical protein
MEWKDRLQLFSSLRNAKILGSNARRRQALAGISIIGGKNAKYTLEAVD